jgi:hypothetical protein
VYSLSVKNARGDKLQLSFNPDYAVRAEGLNALSANINTTKSAGADGSKVNSMALNERNIVLYLKIRPPIEINRNRLYKFFNAKNKVRLFYKNKLVNVYIDGVVENFDCEPFSEKETAIVSIICNDPYFKAADETVYNFTRITPLFEFPFAIAAEGIPFSELTRLTTLTVNHGDVESGVIVEFYATAPQILNPSFYNRTTQKRITLLFDMEQGDKIVINTNRGEKSITLIRDGISSNIINAMDSGSDWVTLEAGENEISFDADHGGENLNVTVTTTNKYMGV